MVDENNKNYGETYMLKNIILKNNQPSITKKSKRIVCFLFTALKVFRKFKRILHKTCYCVRAAAVFSSKNILWMFIVFFSFYEQFTNFGPWILLISCSENYLKSLSECLELEDLIILISISNVTKKPALLFYFQGDLKSHLRK